MRTIDKGMAAFHGECASQFEVAVEAERMWTSYYGRPTDACIYMAWLAIGHRLRQRQYRDGFVKARPVADMTQYQED